MLGLYANDEFKLRWGMTLGPPDPDFLQLMQGMDKLHHAKNQSLYLHAGNGGFEAPSNIDYSEGSVKLRQWIKDLLRWVKGGTIYFIEHDVQWHLDDVQESKQFHESVGALRNCIHKI